MLARHSAKTTSKGDTLIEVLVAFSVFSLAVVGAVAVMNQGSYLAQRSLETTLVSNELSAQAESLRFLHDAYLASYQPGVQYDSTMPESPTKEWLAIQKQVISAGATTYTDLSQIVNTCPSAPKNSFVLDSRNGVYKPNSGGNMDVATSYAQLTYPNQVFGQAQGIWIEAIRNPTNTQDPALAHIGYTDFYIFACWPSIGQDKATTLGTTVRLYEPR